MSVVNATSLASAVNLIRRKFLKRAYEARSNESVTVAFEIPRCLAVTSDLDRFKRAYELLESALGRWREGLARVAEESFRELCSLAAAHPEQVEADPIEWARAQIDALMAEELGSKRCHDVQWNGEDPAPIDSRPKPDRHLEWYTFVCEGSDFVPLQDSEGQTEGWHAPSWVAGRPVMGRPWSDDRMTVRETNSVLRLARSGFELRARFVLDDAVDKARIDLACRPLSFAGHVPGTLPPKPLPPESEIAIALPPSDVQDKASSAHDRESRIRPLLERKGWSTNDWAVQSGVDFHTVSDYLKGDTDPYPSTRAKMAKSLGIDVTELPR